MTMKTAVFLDRDGTLVEEDGYVDRLDRLVFFPYSIDAIRLLNRSGHAVVIVTNQAGVARGIFKESFVAEAHQHITEQLAAAGARIDAFYYCPHHAEGIVGPYRQVCDCRKPQPGMLTRAASELGHHPGPLVRGRRPLARSRGGAGGRRARHSRPHGLRPHRRSLAEGRRPAGRRCRQPDRSRLLDPASVLMRRSSTPPVDSGRLLELIDSFAGTRTAVFGDLIVDEFIYGEIARVSREAPVLILNYDSTAIVPGGAGNAASNVAALGGAAAVVGLAGQDETGRRLLDAMRGHVDVRGVVRPRGFRTPTKTRILAGGIHSAKQQVVRIDRAAGPQPIDAYQRAIASKLLAAAAGCDALIASDYGSGLVTPALVAQAQKALRRRGRRRRRCWWIRATRCCGSAG